MSRRSSSTTNSRIRVSLYKLFPLEGHPLVCICLLFLYWKYDMIKFPKSVTCSNVLDVRTHPTQSFLTEFSHQVTNVKLPPCSLIVLQETCLRFGSLHRKIDWWKKAEKCRNLKLLSIIAKLLLDIYLPVSKNSIEFIKGYLTTNSLSTLLIAFRSNNTIVEKCI